MSRSVVSISVALVLFSVGIFLPATDQHRPAGSAEDENEETEHPSINGA